MPFTQGDTTCSDCGERKPGGEFPADSPRCRACYKRRHADYSIQKRGPFQNVAEWAAFCERFGNICLMCREQLPLTIDHVDPFGPRFDLANIQPLCKRCNCVKAQRFWDFRLPGTVIKYMRACPSCGGRMGQTSGYQDGTLRCTNQRCYRLAMVTACPVVRLTEAETTERAIRTGSGRCD